MIFYLLGLLGYYKLANKAVPASICLLFFAVVTVPPATTLFFLVNKHWAFQLIAYAGGLFCWTFVEYFIHRFSMHGKEKEEYYKTDHFQHHTNPGIIFTGQLKRISASIVAILFTWTSIAFSNYLFLPAGFITGFAMYLNMHRLLHSPLASKWFSRLQKFHMQHHFGQTEKCFGVTSTWWDHLFNTAGKTEKSASAKKISLYFGDNNNQLINHKQAV
jgi:sterol desaturase/sphingolipid hydroxylase (fatty acid hydroxylase superfamily)